VRSTQQLPGGIATVFRASDCAKTRRQRVALGSFIAALAIAFVPVSSVLAAGADEAPRHIEYEIAPAAPAHQNQAEADKKSKGCVSCHTASDEKTMHQSPGVVLGCTDCHGGRADVFVPAGTAYGDAGYDAALNNAHVQPQLPHSWDFPKSESKKHSYSMLNRESPEFIRFMNPSDYRVANEACGACHLEVIEAAKRSLMATGAMLWGGASYNNGILPFKRYVLGESYTRDGEPAMIKNPVEVTPELAAKGVLPELYPMPTWHVIPPADTFRIFERGGRNVVTLFPETGLPNSLGQIQRLEEPGRPDVKQSNRGPGTGARIAVPVINIHKTRLNDPNMWFVGTNDNPGDYRHSGCAGCHVVYANDRDPRHSGPYSEFGHSGESQQADPTIPRGESGHPLKHAFTRAIPTSQCMICHMHQPNMFINSYLGYTMWDYESDAPAMWPKKQIYPSSYEVRDRDVPEDQILGHKRVREINENNPEEAAIRGKWSDQEFLGQVWDMNPKLKDTQFADYHGHGWNFRAVFKRDRKGTLLDAKGDSIADTDPDKWKKTVHMSSIHVDYGMHCVDCHFSNDSHGNGHIVGEVAQAVEIECIDCHGTADEYPTLITTGPAAADGGRDLSLIRNPDGRARFEWREGKLFQRSILWPDREWEMSLVKDSVDPEHEQFNALSSRAKTVAANGSMEWGPGVPPKDRAHKEDQMLCFSCHSSWVTSCGGCHLPIQANWKTRMHHYEDRETRNFATYNPQVARDQMFQLGKHGPVKGHRIAPVRSSSALILSSTDSSRQRIYIQQPPVSAGGYSSQAFAPHFPHTARKAETKKCTDCHVSEENDNNAIMAQLLLHGTNFVNFVGFNAWLGTESEVTAVRVTEWDEPQAVVGSYLHQYAYPDWFEDHQNADKKLNEAYSHDSRGDTVGCLQLRGEYLYAAQGSGGAEVYDVQAIANKGYSQRIITAPFSLLGHDARIRSTDATCIALPTNQPIHPDRQDSPGFGMTGEQMKDLMLNTNMEQPFHPLYDYAFITDSVEGLILTDINTFADGLPRNNFLKRALTWNEGGILDGAQHVTIGGHYLYIAADRGIVILDIDNPLEPKVAAIVPLKGARATALQFRYLFALDDSGMQVIDVAVPEKAKAVDGARVALKDARRLYVARTYAYVAAGPEGLVIVDVEKAASPTIYQRFTDDGKLNDASDVIVGTTNASLFAYVADGANGLKVIQLTSPDIQPKFYGFSPEPKPQVISSYKTEAPARSISKGLDRDRAVDETGHQIAVFGRIGARPFNLEEQRKLYLGDDMKVWTVHDRPDESKLVRKQ
jgi:hypothetical protein